MTKKPTLKEVKPETELSVLLNIREILWQCRDLLVSIVQGKANEESTKQRLFADFFEPMLIGVITHMDKIGILNDILAYCVSKPPMAMKITKGKPLRPGAVSGTTRIRRPKSRPGGKKK